jgi:hypothetical protein
VRLRQVHGRTVLHATGPARSGEDVLLGEGDAVTAEPSRLLAVQTADCVPILLLDPETGLLAAVHAGWRGTALRILDPVLDLLESLGAKPGNLVALFGPSISRDAYEVGPEVIEALTRAQPAPEDAIRSGEGDRSFVDVAAFCAAQLAARGVSRIQRGDFCTLGSPERFPSYRRDGKRAGRIFTGVLRRIRDDAPRRDLYRPRPRRGASRSQVRMPALSASRSLVFLRIALSAAALGRRDLRSRRCAISWRRPPAGRWVGSLD